MPSRNYNATVTHWKQILGTTFGHPGTWNDKTLVLFDDLIKNVHDGKFLQDNEFQLFELDVDEYSQYSEKWALRVAEFYDLNK